MPKRVVILGATGSIGRAALEVAAALPDEIRVVGLAAGQGWQLLAEQAAKFNVDAVAIADERHAADLRSACPSRTKVYAGNGGIGNVNTGSRGIVELVENAEADFVLAAIVGVAGLAPTLAAVERGLEIGLANKESLVVAGGLLMPLAAKRGAKLIPVDSEHSAIFQSLQAGRREDLLRVYLTASGGPFRDWPAERIRNASLDAAMNHPTWSMGPKITIDSATMMNKALEIIEAHYLFGLSAEQIGVLVHPESIVHSMVEFRDGSLIAQLGAPDMKTPIQYAFTFPRRAEATGQRLAWDQARRLHFEPPDFERFPALRLGYAAARQGGTCGAALNAANEAAVEAFRAGRIAFGRIAEICEDVLARHTWTDDVSLPSLLECDARARAEVAACI